MVIMVLLLASALAVEPGVLFATPVNLHTVLLDPVRDFLGLKLPLVPLLPCLVPLVLAETQQESVHGTELGATSSDLASVSLLFYLFLIPFRNIFFFFFCSSRCLFSDH